MSGPLGQVSNGGFGNAEPACCVVDVDERRGIDDPERRETPRGGRIGFASQVVSNWDIYVIDADGSGSRRLTTEPSQEQNPTWSRDGQWIYFNSDRTGGGRVWRVPAFGRRRRPWEK